MPDPLSLIPPGPEYDAIRATLKIMQRDFKGDYAGLASQGARVTGWVNSVKNGTRAADDVRDDIFKHIIGRDALIASGKTPAEADAIILGANEGGANYQASASGDLNDPYGGRTLNNVPGKPEVWKVGKTVYLAYIVPGTEADPVWLTWKATSMDDVQSFFGPGKKIEYDRTLTPAEYKASGAVNFGITDEIPPGAKDPFSTWADVLRTEAITQPWILEADYKKLMVMSILEGRTLTNSEIATTKWWKSHNVAQREWMTLYHGDPQEAQRTIKEAENEIRQTIKDAGGGTASAAVVSFIAGKLVRGDWTASYVRNQITAMTDPYAGMRLDPDLAKVQGVGGVGETQAKEDVVRDLLSTWLGPAFGEWSDAEVARMAGRIRNDPDAELNFVEQLKDQRMALLPEYTDRNTSYAAIANT